MLELLLVLLGLLGALGHYVGVQAKPLEGRRLWALGFLEPPKQWETLAVSAPFAEDFGPVLLPSEIHMRADRGPFSGCRSSGKFVAQGLNPQLMSGSLLYPVWLL